MVFQVGPFEFKSREACRRHLSGMLEAWWKKAEITGSDRDLLDALLERHPGVLQKRGAGVLRFFVSTAEPRGRCFWVWRVDGTAEHFSFMECLKPTSSHAKLRTACREAVAPSVHAFKLAAFSDGMATCAETGALLQWSGAHVDHIEPFHALADQWIDANGINAGHLAEDTAQTYADRFADPAMAEAFRVHHDRVARLRIVSVAVNLSKGGR
jgi:hypothetical protein